MGLCIPNIGWLTDEWGWARKFGDEARYELIGGFNMRHLPWFFFFFLWYVNWWGLQPLVLFINGYKLVVKTMSLKSDFSFLSQPAVVRSCIHQFMGVAARLCPCLKPPTVHPQVKSNIESAAESDHCVATWQLAYCLSTPRMRLLWGLPKRAPEYVYIYKSIHIFHYNLQSSILNLVIN